MVRLARQPNARQTRHLAQSARIEYISKHTPQRLRIPTELKQG